MNPSATLTSASPARAGRAGPSRARWLGALGAGTLLWFGAVVVSHAFPSAVLGLRLEGPVYAFVAVLFAPLALGAVALGLRTAGRRPREVGLTVRRGRSDAVIGAAVAIGWALLQFLVIIPATGGAERADVVMNAEQIGDSLSGLAAFVLLAWAGGLAEELFFRLHLMTTLRGALGASRAATFGVAAVPVVLFAAVHGYQGGWVGMLDAGAFGGLALTALFLWRKRLTACIVAHGLWNTLASVVIFFRY